MWFHLDHARVSADLSRGPSLVAPISLRKTYFGTPCSSDVAYPPIMTHCGTQYYLTMRVICRKRIVELIGELGSRKARKTQYKSADVS